MRDLEMAGHSAVVQELIHWYICIKDKQKEAVLAVLYGKDVVI